MNAYIATIFVLSNNQHQYGCNNQIGKQPRYISILTYWRRWRRAEYANNRDKFSAYWKRAARGHANVVYWCWNQSPATSVKIVQCGVSMLVLSS